MWRGGCSGGCCARVAWRGGGAGSLSSLPRELNAAVMVARSCSHVALLLLPEPRVARGQQVCSPARKRTIDRCRSRPSSILSTSTRCQCPQIQRLTSKPKFSSPPRARCASKTNKNKQNKLSLPRRTLLLPPPHPAPPTFPSSASPPPPLLSLPSSLV